MLSFSRSPSGAKARAPKWWGRLLDGLPRLYLRALGPRSWTPQLAERWVRWVPSKCPFERQVWWGETLILYVPPLCPLNPFSHQLYEIRLEAQTYLSELRKGGDPV